MLRTSPRSYHQNKFVFARDVPDTVFPDRTGNSLLDTDQKKIITGHRIVTVYRILTIYSWISTISLLKT